MRITVERLRTGILLAGAALVTAILLFFAYARWRVRHIGRDLPARLGIEIQQSTNGFTLSKSESGRTLFTLHASKAVQYKGGGRATLHDVSITLYGRNGVGADHVAGSEFEYDPATGMARALGPVTIEIAAPKPSGNAGRGAQPIRMRTSGLVFSQKTGLASTADAVDFALGAGQGSAKGARYDSRAGILTLDSDVALHSVLNGDPLALRAAHAEFNRQTSQLALLNDAVEYGGAHSASDQALVTFRPDGSMERVRAGGHVRVNGQEDETVNASQAEVRMNAQGQPVLATLDGGVVFHALRDSHDVHGNAVSGTLRLGAHGALEHLRLQNAANVVDQESPLPEDPHGSITRQVLASQLDIDFAPGDSGRAEATAILAQGGATVEEHAIYANAPAQMTKIEGQQLYATLRNGNALDTLRGSGSTRLTNSSANGATETSSGDALEAWFAPGASPTPGAKAKPKAAEAGIAGLLTKAVQRGRVQIVQTHPGANGQPAAQSTASADEADFDGKTQTVQLRGGAPQLASGATMLTAQTITLERMTGNVSAKGGVKATERQQGAKAAAPAHIVAAQAFFDHVKDEATFTADPGSAARVWQGANSISAPQIVLSRKRETLTASGPQNAGQSVHAVLSGASEKPAGAAASPDAIVRAASPLLVYSAAERKAEFRGGVLVQQQDAAVRADTVEVYLAESGGAGKLPAAKSEAPAGGAPGAAAPIPDGGVERIVARGHVQLTQPGRQASGEMLVYTAFDARWELTGTAAHPARLTDAAHGGVTGSSLIFNSRDDSVEVDGGPAQAVTDTRVRK